MKSFSSKSLLMLLIIIVLCFENIKTFCDSSTSSSDDGCKGETICHDNDCITLEHFQHINKLKIRVE